MKTGLPYLGRSIMVEVDGRQVQGRINAVAPVESRGVWVNLYKIDFNLNGEEDYVLAEEKILDECFQNNNAVFA